MRTLEVYCDELRAGQLVDADDGLAFAYDDAWLEQERPLLSQTLPLREPPSREATRAFFSGLLPEGRPRQELERRLGISKANDFSLLEALGGDCPGAISLYPPGTFVPGADATADVTWLSEHEVAELIATLPERPMLADQAGEIRLSLAGAQDKLPVVVEDGRIGLTAGRAPSTHILKTPIPRHEGTVVNEAFCLALGRELGIRTVHAEPTRADGSECLLVERYDRRREGGRVVRLHQEDFCQALGLRPERKYQADGGPSLEDCFGLVRAATSVPARHLSALLDAVALSFLVGNYDAHGKNLSLLYTGQAVELASFYDILATAVYPGLSRKLAMKIGGEYRPDYVEARHVDRMLAAAGLAPAASRRQLARLAAEAPDAARAVRARLAADEWDHPVLDRVLAMVDRRSTHLRRIASGSR